MNHILSAFRITDLNMRRIHTNKNLLKLGNTHFPSGRFKLRSSFRARKQLHGTSKSFSHNRDLRNMHINILEVLIKIYYILNHMKDTGNIFLHITLGWNGTAISNCVITRLTHQLHFAYITRLASNFPFSLI